MSLLEIIKNRRSVREFQSAPLDRQIVNDLIEALRWAPSAGNLQSRKFYLITNQKKQAQLAAAAHQQDFIAQAPLVVAGCADLQKASRLYGKRGEELFAVCDVACSLQNLMLTAYERGLGSVWVGAFREMEVAQILDLPTNLRPIALVPVGFPNEEPHAPPRFPANQVVEKVD